MRRLQTAAILGLVALTAPVQAGDTKWSIGVRFGGPVGFGPPCCGPYYPRYYYRPYYPVYVPPPVVVAPTPVYVQPAPVVQPVIQQPVIQQPVIQQQPVYQQPQPVPPVQPAYQQQSAIQTTSNVAVPQVSDAEASRYLGQLADPDERVRIDSVLWLGRNRVTRAIDPLAATLAGDRSPAVREAAARALALIGSTRGLPALRQAALADGDASVRHSAQFAVEVVQSPR